MGASSDIKKEISYNLNEELLCYRCGQIPEVLNIYTDNSKIELNCKNCGLYELLIDEYYDELSKNNYFKKCSRCGNEDINNKYFHCFDCKRDYCELCKNEYHPSHHYSIQINIKKDYCLEHNEKLKYFCFDCQEIFVKKN